MTRRTQRGTPPRSLPALEAVHELVPAASRGALTWESAMHLVPEQLARNHLEQRMAEAAASRVRRAARAARRAESAERRARLAREAAVLAARESVHAAAR